MNKPRHTSTNIKDTTLTRENMPFQTPPGNPERIQWAVKQDRERSEKEKAPYKPYVAHVDEWLEGASEADDATDSWVARTEADLFNDMGDDPINATVVGGVDDSTLSTIEEAADEDFADEDFAEDEFAADDFGSRDFHSSSYDDVPTFGDDAVKELDGWVLNTEEEQQPLEGLAGMIENPGDSPHGGYYKGDVRPEMKLSESEVESLFDLDDDDYEPTPRSTSGDRSGRG